MNMSFQSEEPGNIDPVGWIEQEKSQMRGKGNRDRGPLILGMNSWFNLPSEPSMQGTDTNQHRRTWGH